MHEQEERGRAVNKEGDERDNGQGNVYGRVEVGVNKNGSMFEGVSLVNNDLQVMSGEVIQIKQTKDEHLTQIDLLM